LQQLAETHRGAKAAATVVTATVDRPYGYGRVVRTNGRIARIVEERDASPAERQIREINSGIYAFDLGPLFEALRGIASENAQGQYYLTDLVAIYRRRKQPVETLIVADPDEIRGINSRTELAEVSRIVRQNKNEELMAAGVTLVDPAATYIDADVEIGADTVIHPGVVIEGQTRIGPACEIQAHVRIVDSILGSHVSVNSFCLIVGASVADGAAVGPFAHLRPESVVGEKARVGNFVELKKTTLGAGSKANHHAYLGNATIGANVNIGAGTIVCNYDGETKHETSIEDGAFIGSDTQLIAPVTVGRGAYVGTGTTVRENVPPGALAVSAGKQRNIEGWVARKRGTPAKK
jgi:bifunctional UDP-N-acetylglucosamine pyrophosphorylase/glucosamine-1-phosphate N-acetyltransferase